MPAIAWATFKPVRILAPALNGVTCADRVCVEDPSRLTEALALQRAAVAEVGRKLVPLKDAPVTVFCSTRRCYHSFGGGMERGAALFNWGVILPPESWVPYIVEHESSTCFKPAARSAGEATDTRLFKEGMPFSSASRQPTSCGVCSSARLPISGMGAADRP